MEKEITAFKRSIRLIDSLKLPSLGGLFVLRIIFFRIPCLCFG